MDNNTLLNMFTSPQMPNTPPPPVGVAPPIPGATGLDVSNQPGPLRGPGGGIDDLIPASIGSGGKQTPAALSPGEFVWPAASVAFLGDGDSNFGAEMLNAAKTDPTLLSSMKALIRAHMQQNQGKKKQ